MTFFGALLCWLGFHGWGRWRTAPWTLPGIRWRYCERIPRTCKAKQFDSVRDVSDENQRPAERREGGE